MVKINILKFSLILLFACLSFFCKGNSIDKLNTLDDVKAFLKSNTNFKEGFDFFEIFKTDTAAKLAQTKFIKTDLNKDGATDLIVNGTYLFAVIDNGEKGYRFFYIDERDTKYVLADIDTLHGTPKVIVKLFRGGDLSIKTHGYDTLVVKYNGFIEYNKAPEKKEAEKISFSAMACLQQCPVFTLSVSSDGSARYKATQYNDVKGNFQCNIDEENLDNLFDLIKYVSPLRLKDKYAVEPVDGQTVYITILYKDGTVKNIKDYGLEGTFGLKQLYNTLFRLRNIQDWIEL